MTRCLLAQPDSWGFALRIAAPDPPIRTASRMPNSPARPGHVTRVASDEIDCPNALVISPDEERLYSADDFNHAVGTAPARQRRLASSAEAASITLSAAPGLYGVLSTS